MVIPMHIVILLVKVQLRAAAAVDHLAEHILEMAAAMEAVVVSWHMAPVLVVVVAALGVIPVTAATVHQVLLVSTSPPE